MRTAYPHDLVKGAVIRVPAAPGYRKRPFGLEIAHREPDSKETGAITLLGRVLAQDGTTTRARAPYRTIVIATWMEPVALLRKAPPPEYTAKLATLTRPRPGGGTDLITRWGVVDEHGVPLPGEGLGPATTSAPCGAELHAYMLAGDWEGKPTPWLARELCEQTPEERRLRRDPIDQCMDRVRQERGILHVERLTYDLSAWPHDPVMELADGQWKATRTCKRCERILQWEGQRPWWSAKDDGDTECHGEVWVP